ncbi:hypothetical protein F5Y17DRAFT_467714 [Xylariaceae sp. FL0594]|nr:hypothetical protein F5Y17DRAFT_467714 [Xylariaceae sp. FL0594]
MVGVPKSQRCNFCKTRKTKCDEKWPTCGTCARAGQVCSGASAKYKFVGKHELRPDSEHIYTYIFDKGCASPSHLECITPPRSHVTWVMDVPWSSGNRLTARLVSYLNATPATGTDLRMLGAFLPLLPQQMGRGNKALDCAVELLLDAWTNCRRGLPPHSWLDLDVYNKALISLKGVLHDEDPDVLNNTFAAQCLLQKTEVLFDFTRGSNEETHGAGLIAIIAKAGPTLLMSEVSLHVMFEGIYHMLQEDIRQNRDSAFHTPDWMATLTRSIDASSLGFVLKQLYHLWVQTTAWPGLVRLVRLLRSGQSSVDVAQVLYTRARLLARFLHFQEEALSALLKTGDISEVDNLHDPALFPRRFEFRDYPTAKLFAVHAAASIISCRAIQEANRALGHNDPSVERKARFFSKRIWMSSYWMQDHTPLAVDYTGSLAFAYESGDDEEREFCIRALRGMEAFRHPPPVGEWNDATIKANAMAFTGRLPFIRTCDPRVEYDGIGCRIGYPPPLPRALFDRAGWKRPSSMRRLAGLLL